MAKSIRSKLCYSDHQTVCLKWRCVVRVLYIMYGYDCRLNYELYMREFSWQKNGIMIQYYTSQCRGPQGRVFDSHLLPFPYSDSHSHLPSRTTSCPFPFARNSHGKNL